MIAPRIWLPRSKANQAKPRFSNNLLIVGMTGSGKSSLERLTIREMALKRDCAIFIFCPEVQKLGYEALMDVIGLGMEYRTDISFYDDPSRILAPPIQDPSKSRDSYIRESENNETTMTFAELTAGLQRNETMLGSPVKFDAVTSACALWMSQERPTPLKFRDWQHVFYPNDPIHHYAVAHCQDPMTKFVFENMPQAGSRNWVDLWLPGKRVFDTLYKFPAVRAHMDGTWDIREAIRENRIVIFCRNGKSKMSPWTIGVLLSLLIQQVIRAQRHEKEETGVTPNTVIVADELGNYPELLSRPLVRALGEMRSMGLDFHLLSTHLAFDPEILIRLLGDCPELKAMKTGDPDSAMLLAKAIGLGNLDPMKVHHEEEITRSIPRPTRQERRTDRTTRDGKTSETERLVDVRDYDTFVDRKAIYQDLNSQILMTASSLMRLNAREFIGRTMDSCSTRPQVVPELEVLWAFGSERATQKVMDAVQRIQARPYYTTPDLSPSKLLEFKSQARFSGGRGGVKS